MYMVKIDKVLSCSKSRPTSRSTLYKISLPEITYLPTFVAFSLHLQILILSLQPQFTSLKFLQIVLRKFQNRFPPSASDKNYLIHLPLFGTDQTKSSPLLPSILFACDFADRTMTRHGGRTRTGTRTRGDPAVT
jgi:hypothetical protein